MGASRRRPPALRVAEMMAEQLDLMGNGNPGRPSAGAGSGSLARPPGSLAAAGLHQAVPLPCALLCQSSRRLGPLLRTEACLAFGRETALRLTQLRLQRLDLAGVLGRPPAVVRLRLLEPLLQRGAAPALLLHLAIQNLELAPDALQDLGHPPDLGLGSADCDLRTLSRARDVTVRLLAEC
jgi:hypothetical protein